MKNDSLILSILYTVGHIIIAGVVVYVMTGSTIWKAGSVALIEPMLNGLWLYILHRVWKQYMRKDSP